MALFFCFLLGMCSSTLAGLFGLGGGMLVVPGLVMLFHAQDMSSDVRVHMAMGTSLAVMIITGMVAVYARSRAQKIAWPIFRQLMPGIIIGVSLGVAIASLLSGPILRHLFGLFLLVIAARMFMLVKPKPERQLPGFRGLSLFGLGVGLKSGLLGVGGGILTVPFLLRHNLDMLEAAALSSSCSLLIAICGTTGFMLSGWHAGVSLPYSTGYIYWPAFMAIAVASVIFAPLGVKLSHYLPINMAKRIFAGLLLIIGLRMLLL